MTMNDFKCQQLQKEVSMLKQQLEFRTMQRDQYKDREMQMKRMNESLVKALEEQRPNNQNLTEVKLLVQQYGGGQKERELQAQLERLKRNIQNQVSQRVRAIVIESEIKFKTCSRCKELDNKVSELQLEIMRLKSKNNSQTEYTDDIQSKYSYAMDQLQAKQTKLMELQNQFKRYKQDYERDVQLRRNNQHYENQNVTYELNKKVFDIERKKEEQVSSYKRQLQNNLQETLQQQITKVERKYEEMYRQKVVQLQERIQRQRQSLNRRQQDIRKQARRMTPVKTLTYHEQTQIYNQPRDFSNSRIGVSPTWRKQNKTYNTVNTMQGQIKSLINVISKNKQQQYRGGDSQISGYSNGGYYQDDGSEYSNFSIKEAIIRPNNLMQNHYRLKNGNRFN